MSREQLDLLLKYIDSRIKFFMESDSLYLLEAYQKMSDESVKMLIKSVEKGETE